MSRARVLLQSEGTVQVSRITQAVDLREATLARSTSIPPVDDTDIEVVVSTGMTADYGGIPLGQLHLLNGEVVHVSADSNFGKTSTVGRQDDAFTMNYNPTVEPELLVTNRPPGDYSEGGTALYTRRQINSVALEDVVLLHNGVTPLQSNRTTFDEFYALRLGDDGRSGHWEHRTLPLAPYSTETTLSSAVEAPYKMIAVDGTTAIVGGSYGLAGGFKGRMHMVQYDEPTGALTGYGPFDFGAISAEGDANTTAQVIMVRLDESRLLVMWQSYLDVDFSDTTDLYPRRPLFAQVFTYDTTAHTIAAAGDMRTFESGLEGGDIQAFFYPGYNVVVLAGLNWPGIDNLGQNASGWTGEDLHLGARTLLIGDDNQVSEGTSAFRVASLGAQTDAADHWYGYQVVGAADRLVFMTPDVGADYGNINYTKVRVGLVAGERGGLGVYDDGVLIPDAGANLEFTQHGHQLALDATSNLALFEQYTDDYDWTDFVFVLAREV